MFVSARIIITFVVDAPVSTLSFVNQPEGRELRRQASTGTEAEVRTCSSSRSSTTTATSPGRRRPSRSSRWKATAPRSKRGHKISALASLAYRGFSNSREMYVGLGKWCSLKHHMLSVVLRFCRVCNCECCYLSTCTFSPESQLIFPRVFRAVDRRLWCGGTAL